MNPRSKVAALALSAAALVGIVAHEGYRGEAYIPVPGDRPTIGFGSANGVKMGDKTNPVAALERALSDINKFEGAIKRCVKVPLHQYEYDTFVSMVYNVGSGAFCGSTLVEKLNVGDYSGACEEILKWRFFQKKDCALPENRCSGLWHRRQAEYKQCMGVAR